MSIYKFRHCEAQTEVKTVILYADELSCHYEALVNLFRVLLRSSEEYLSYFWNEITYKYNVESLEKICLKHVPGQILARSTLLMASLTGIFKALKK